MTQNGVFGRSLCAGILVGKTDSGYGTPVSACV